MDITTLSTITRAYSRISAIKSPSDLDKYNKWLNVQKDKGIDVDAIQRLVYPALAYQIQQLKETASIDIQKPYDPPPTPPKKVSKPRAKKSTQPPLTMED